MKIALMYANWESSGETWGTPHGIKYEFISRGHDVRVYNLYHRDGVLSKRDSIRKYSSEGVNQLAADIRNGIFNPDVIMTMDYGPFQSLLINKNNFPNAILIKEAGDEPQSHQMHKQTAYLFDFVLSPDLECVDKYRQNGINAYWWTHHADTEIFYPRDIEPIWDCVTTCGPRGNGLTDEIQLALGEEFNNERYFYGEDHAIRLHQGRMVFQCSQYGEITRRIFEGMACNRMVITDRLHDDTGINDLFQDGKHIVYYDNAKDAIDKIKYYASHHKEREAIATNGFQEVFAYHTAISRVDFIENLLKGK